MSDLYSASTVLLLHMEGGNNSQVFTDSSNVQKTVTVYGDAKISTTQSKWGNGSGYFDGNGDYLGVSNATLALGASDFTVEAYIYPTVVSGFNVFLSSRLASSTGVPYWLFSVEEGQLTFQSRNNSSVQYFAKSASSAIIENNWYHVAATRESGVLKVWLNGVVGPTTGNDLSNNLSEASIAVSLFNFPGYVAYFAGYIQDVRITNGIARYASDFTPPSRLPDPDPITGRILSGILRRDMEFGGGYQIIGTAQRLGANARKRIRLHDRRTGMLIREVWSATDGSFAFTYLKNAPESYIVMELDDEANNPWLDPACADRVSAEPMP